MQIKKGNVLTLFQDEEMDLSKYRVTHLKAPNGYQYKLRPEDSLKDILNDIADAKFAIRKMEEEARTVRKKQDARMARKKQDASFTQCSSLTRLRPRNRPSTEQVKETLVTPESTPTSKEAMSKGDTRRKNEDPKGVKVKSAESRPRPRDLTSSSSISSGSTLTPTSAADSAVQTPSSSNSQDYDEVDSAEWKDVEEEQMTEKASTAKKEKRGRGRPRRKTSEAQKKTGAGGSQEKAQEATASASEFSGGIPLTTGRVDDGVYLVDGIVDHHIVKLTDGAVGTEYKVKWSGWPMYSPISN